MSKKNRTKEENRNSIRRWRLKNLYGITEEEYQAILSDQKSVCKICGMPPKGRFKNLAVDHSHNTGQIRGLLCQFCNVALGWFEKHRPNVEKYLGESFNRQDLGL